MSKWQPIETAPRDGTKIIGCTGPETFVIWLENGVWVSEGMWFEPAAILTWVPLPSPMTEQEIEELLCLFDDELDREPVK